MDMRFYMRLLLMGWMSFEFTTLSVGQIDRQLEAEWLAVCSWMPS